MINFRTKEDANSHFCIGSPGLFVNYWSHLLVSFSLVLLPWELVFSSILARSSSSSLHKVKRAHIGKPGPGCDVLEPGGPPRPFTPLQRSQEELLNMAPSMQYKKGSSSFGLCWLSPSSDHPFSRGWAGAGARAARGALPNDL